MSECTKDTCVCVVFLAHVRHADHCAKCSHPRRLHPGLKQELTFFSPSLILARKGERETPAPGTDKGLMPFAKTPYFSQLQEKGLGRGGELPGSRLTAMPRAKSALLSENEVMGSGTARSLGTARPPPPDVQIRGRRGRQEKSPLRLSQGGGKEMEGSEAVQSLVKAKSTATRALLLRNSPLVDKPRSKSPGDRSTSRRRIVLKSSHSVQPDRLDQRSRAVSASDIRHSPYRVRLPRSATPPPQPSVKVFVVPSPQKSPGRSARLSPKVPLLDLAGLERKNQKEVVSEYFAGASLDTSYQRPKIVKYEDECLKLYCVATGHRNTVRALCLWTDSGFLSTSSDYTTALWTIPRQCSDPYKATAREFQPGSLISPAHSFRAHTSPIHCAVALSSSSYCTAAADALIKVLSR